MTNSENMRILEIAKRLKAMADTGLLFTNDEYDKERYIELNSLSAEIMALDSGLNTHEIQNYFLNTTDYPTPKVDVRGFLLNDKNEILMVQEKCDMKWTIPGGWCEVGISPKENILKEMEEETGLDVQVNRVLAIFDKSKHPHPPQPHYVYKIIYYCTCANSTILNPNHEINDAQFFSINKLPNLSEDRIIKNQLDILLQKALEKDLNVYSD